VKVLGATVTPVAFADPPLLNSMDVHEPFALRSILQVRFGDGLVGLGESYGDDAFVTLLERVAGAVVGVDVWDLHRLRRRVGSVVGAATFQDRHGLTGVASNPKTVATLYAAFEVAFLDAQGKLVGRPLCDLLGGAVRRSVPFSAYLFYKWAAHPGGPDDEWGAALDPAGVAAQARRMVEDYGFGSLKLKGGVWDPDQEMETVLELAAAFPGLPLRWDPNAAWTVPTSKRVALAMDGVLEYLEDPTGGRRGMAEVAREAPMPLATNMCVVSFADLPEAVELGAVGVLLSDHHYWGGPRPTQVVSEICETFGIGLSMHSNSHLGISLAAMVHTAASTPHLSYACDTHWPWKREDEDVIVGGSLVFAEGAVAVPTGPGLGVELDPDALARLHERYERCGLRRRDDTAYMRSFDPDFSPRVDRW
jgi:glucarate dehydratase